MTPQDWKGTGASEDSERHLSSASSQLPRRLRMARGSFSQPGPRTLSSQPVRFKEIFFFFFFNLFIYGCVGSSFLCEGFL